MKKIAVILSGGGFLDGSEITESVSTLIALSQNQADYQIFAPNKEFQATDHLSRQGLSQNRNMLNEAARIARGKISPLDELKVTEFDGLALPGGFGVAKHLCNWAEKGARCSVDPDVERVITEFYKTGRPICAICIAPALVARVLGKNGVSVTVGQDAETAHEIDKTGAHHVVCPVDDFVSDRENKIITTPAYMYEAKPNEVFAGISAAIKEFVEMA